MALQPEGWFGNAAWRQAAGSRPARLALTTAAWLAAAAAIGLLAWMSMTFHARFRLQDLYVYRAGGAAVLHGHPVYALRTRAGLLFTYPPAAAVLAVPLALLSWPGAQVAWLAMIYVPLAVVTWMSLRPLLARAGSWAPAVLAAGVAGAAYLMPLRQEIHYGQVDIFLVALCLLDCATVAPRWPRGALVGLATAIKLVPGVFIVYLLITGRRKAAGVATVSFAAVTGLTWLIAPGDSRAYWTGAIYDSRRLGDNVQAANQSLRGIVLRLFAPAAAPELAWLLAALVVAVAGFAAARAAARRGQELAGIAITGLLAALLSPVAWIHHLCWVVIAIGVLVGDGRSRRRLLAAALAAVLFTAKIPIWGKLMLEHHSAPVAVSRLMEASFGLGAIALIWMIWAFRPSQADLRPPAPLPGGSAGAGTEADPAVLAGSRSR